MSESIDYKKFIKGIRKVCSLRYQEPNMSYHIDIIGENEAQCLQKLENWINGTYTVQIRESEGKIMENIENTTTVTEAVQNVTNEISDNVKKSNKGAHFVGKIWLVNPTLKEKKRVAAEEVDALLAAGWQKGGPRTKFD